MSNEISTISGNQISNSVVGTHMENIQLTIQSLPAGKSELREALEKLKNHASPMLGELPKEHAEDTAQDLEDFTKEVVKERPHKGKVQDTGKRLIETAQSVAKYAPTVIESVEKIKHLLGF